MRRDYLNKTSYAHGMAENQAERCFCTEELPKLTPTLVELNLPRLTRPANMFLDKVYADQIRYVAYERGMAGNHA